MASKRGKPGEALSSLAATLLRDLAASPSRVEYNTRLLGGMFEEPDLSRLDAAYAERRKAGLIEAEGATISFFGTPKSLHRITPNGRKFVQELAA
jgi:hypothetical protein